VTFSWPTQPISRLRAIAPARKQRRGRDPATGEEIEIAAKPASVDARSAARQALAGAASAQKARRRLAA
jgi:hypothetical protein